MQYPTAEPLHSNSADPAQERTMADEETTETETESTEEQTSEETTAEGGGTEQSESDTTDWKAQSRKWERDAKANKAAAKELAEIRAKNQTDAERTTSELASANDRIKAATRRAVKAEVKSAASTLKFTDPADALAMLDLDDLTNDDGEVDDAAILKELKAIAAAKPYLLAGPGVSGKSGGEVGGGDEKTGEKSVDDYVKEYNK